MHVIKIYYSMIPVEDGEYSTKVNAQGYTKEFQYIMHKFLIMCFNIDMRTN